MITPKYLTEIVKKTEAQLAELNEYLTSRVAERFAHGFLTHGERILSASSLSDIYKLLEIGTTAQEVEKELSRKMPAMQTYIREAFLDSAGEISNNNTDFAKKVIEYARDRGELGDVEIPKFDGKGLNGLNITEHEAGLLESAYRRTNGEIRNLTRTTAADTEAAYIKACDDAFFKVQHGVSMDTAITEGIQDLAKRGINVVNYRTGKTEGIEVAVARSVRTGINQANGDICLARNAEMGVNFVVVSEHMGARVTKREDYTNHAHWQGKAYKLDWNKPELAKYSAETGVMAGGRFEFLGKIKSFFSNLKTKKYPDFVEMCGYGKLLGICGVNCRHTFNPFYPGISTEPEQAIDEEENEQAYKEQQTARGKERDIRKTKRVVSGLQVAGLESDEAQATLAFMKEKLEKQLDDCNAYCKKHHIPRAGWRTQIGK